MESVNKTLYIPLYGKAYVSRKGTDLHFVKEHEMTPDSLINELDGMEKIVFKKIFGGKVSHKMYRLYEYRTDC